MSIPIKEEFKLRNFFLNYEIPHHFYTSTIEKPKHLYLIWRIFWFLFHCGGIIAIFSTRADVRLLTFATIWGYLLLSLTTLIDIILIIFFEYVSASSYQAENHQHPMPWYLKVSWFFSNVAYDGAILITFAYWTLLFKGPNGFLGLNILEHAINSVYSILNMFVSNKPIRILHFWYGMLCMVAYITFLGIYYSAGGLSISGHRYIYPFLDFGKPKQLAIYVVSLIVAFPIVHFFNYLLYRSRLWLLHKFQGKIESTDDLSSSKRDLEIVT